LQDLEYPRPRSAGRYPEPGYKVHTRHVASGYIHDLARYCIAPPRYLWGRLRAISTGRTFVCCTVDLCTSPPIPVYGTPRLIGTGNGEKIKRCSPSLNYSTSKGIPASSKAFLARSITSAMAGNPTTAADVGATRIACTVSPIPTLGIYCGAPHAALSRRW
jgi:hypothetical protein